MSQRSKLVILSIITAGLLILISKQVITLHQGIKQLHAPTLQTRQGSPSRIHHWMTVKEAVRNYGISEEEVYTYLKITPEPGDQNLTFRTLEKKYHLSIDEMHENLERLIHHVEKQDSHE